MVGKIIRRRRLHQPAAKPTQPQQSGREEELSAAVLTFSANTGKEVLTSDIFSGVNIDPKFLVKKLDTDSRNPVSVIKDEDERVMSKKEKMKIRRERWLQKIESIKLAKQQHKAVAKRRMTPVVGDMHPLMDALPELSDLVKAEEESVDKFQPDEIRPETQGLGRGNGTVSQDNIKPFVQSQPSVNHQSASFQKTKTGERGRTTLIP